MIAKAAKPMIKKLACCRGDLMLSIRNPELIDPDFNVLMNYFCNEWPGKSGKLKGCHGGKPELMHANVDAWNVFARTGLSAGASDLKAAMEMSGVKDFRDCWQRITILREEFGRK